MRLSDYCAVAVDSLRNLQDLVALSLSTVSTDFRLGYQQWEQMCRM